MRYAVISDLHANPRAVEATLRHIEALGVDEVVCLGDIVGYYAEPSACLRIIRERNIECVSGNHDRAACGRLSFADAGATARSAMDWTRRQLNEEEKNFLAELPLLRVYRSSGFSMVHGALHPTPNTQLHLSSLPRVARSLDKLQSGYLGTRICFYGHTHRAAIHQRRQSTTSIAPRGRVLLEADCYYLVNPGSVGQPRDRDPRPSFAVFDSERMAMEFHRCAHDATDCHALAKRYGLLPKRRLHHRIFAALQRLTGLRLRPNRRSLRWAR